MRRRDVLTGFAAAAGLAILSACGGGETPTATRGAAATAGGAPTAATIAPTTTTGAPTPPAPPATATSTAAPAASASPQAASGSKGAFASQIDTTNMRKGGSLIDAMPFNVATFNPILVREAASQRINHLIYDRIVEIDPDTLQPTPNLATKWEIAPDGKTYTFTLKQGVKWHDGQPFAADDVKFTFDLLMNPDTGSTAAGTLNDRIAAIEVKDPQTIVFTAKDVIAPFMLSMNTRIVPKHILDGVAPKDIKSHPLSMGDPKATIGTGPFKFKEFKEGDHVTLAANPDHHRGAPNLDAYVLRYIADSTVIYQQLKTGEVDFYYFVDPSFYDDARKQSNLTIVPYELFALWMFGYNLDATNKSAHPAFQDVQVRQALFYAVDRKAIVDRIRYGLSTVAIGTEPDISWAYQPDKIALKYDYDPKKAAQMLDAAGWTKGGDGIRAKDGRKLAFSMYATSGDKTQEGYLSVMQENFKDIGVAMTPVYEELSQFTARTSKTFDFEAFFTGLGIGVDPDQTTVWGTKSHGPGFNSFAYSNPKVDQILNDALHTLDLEKRKQLYVDMQNIVLADAPALPMDYPKNLGVLNKRVKNLVPNAVQTAFNGHQWYVTDGK